VTNSYGILSNPKYILQSSKRNNLSIQTIPSFQLIRSNLIRKAAGSAVNISFFLDSTFLKHIYIAAFICALRPSYYELKNSIINFVSFLNYKLQQFIVMNRKCYLYLSTRTNKCNVSAKMINYEFTIFIHYFHIKCWSYSFCVQITVGIIRTWSNLDSEIAASSVHLENSSIERNFETIRISNRTMSRRVLFTPMYV